MTKEIDNDRNKDNLVNLPANIAEGRARREANRRAGERQPFPLRLSPEAQDALSEIMRLGGLSTFAEAMRQAIGDELFIQKRRADGWETLLRKGDEYCIVDWPGRTSPSNSR